MTLYREQRGRIADYCGKDGAVALAHVIAAFWAARGHAVRVTLHDAGYHNLTRNTRVDVRSDMKNGRPAQI